MKICLYVVRVKQTPTHRARLPSMCLHVSVFAAACALEVCVGGGHTHTLTHTHVLPVGYVSFRIGLDPLLMTDDFQLSVILITHYTLQ